MELNKIYCMDCLECLKKIEDNSIDLIITSPPYADKRKNCYDSVSEKDYVDWFLPIGKELYRILKPDGSFFLNIKPHCVKGERSFYVWELVMSLKNNVGFRFVDEFCWTKIGVPGKFKGRFKNAFEPVYHFSKTKDFKHNPYSVATEIKEESIKRANRKACGESQNGSGFAGLREGSTLKDAKLALPSNHLHLPQKSNQYTLQSKHPAVFPVELPTFFIKAFSNENDVVLDCFMGSGTTALACINTNRYYIGIDNNEEYVKLALKRLI